MGKNRVGSTFIIQITVTKTLFHSGLILLAFRDNPSSATELDTLMISFYGQST